MEFSELFLANPYLLTVYIFFFKSSKLFLYFNKKLMDVKVCKLKLNFQRSFAQYNWEKDSFVPKQNQLYLMSSFSPNLSLHTFSNKISIASHSSLFHYLSILATRKFSHCLVQSLSTSQTQQRSKMFVDHGEQILSVICGEAFHVPQDCYHASECFLPQSNNHSAIHFPLISVFSDLCSLLQLPLETLQLPNSPSPESSHCTQTV